MNSITIIVVEKKYETPRDVCILRCATEADLLAHASEVRDFLDGMIVTGDEAADNPGVAAGAANPEKSARNAGVLAAQLVSRLRAKPDVYTEVEISPIRTLGRDSEYIYTVKVQSAPARTKALALSLKKKGVNKLLYREGPICGFVPENLAVPGI